MIVTTRIDQLNSCLVELEKIHSKNIITDPRLLQLGNHALRLLNDLINENPTDFDLRCNRIKLNSDWLFSNYELIITDAQYIISNPTFTHQKLFGYKWLLIINEKTGTTLEKIAILENKLIDIHLIYQQDYQLNKILAETYYDLAKAYFEAENEIYAYELLELSYTCNPYLSTRNLYLGLHMLKKGQFAKAEIYLWAHFLWGNHTSKNEIMKYGVILNTLYENDKLENYPNLIALLYHIIRSNKSSFGCSLLTDFYKLFGDKLRCEIIKFPTNSKLRVVLANTYYLDFNDNKKALKHYKKMLAGDDPFFQSYVTRIYSSLEKKCDFIVKLLNKKPGDFKTKNLFSYYHMANDLFTIYLETKDIQYLKLSEHYVKHSYDIMNAYLKYNTGDLYCNSLNHYDYICNLYGKILSSFAKNSTDLDQTKILLVSASSVYFDGFKYNLNADNLELAIEAAFESNNTDLFIFYVNQLANIESKLTISLESLKAIYRINYKLLKSGELKKMTSLYLATKKIFDNQKIKNGDYIEVFVNMGFDFFTLSIEKNQNFNFIFTEINCILSKENIKEVHTDIYGVLLYYLGLCYHVSSDDLNAKKSYQNAILILKDIHDDDFIGYYNLVLTAYEALK